MKQNSYGIGEHDDFAEGLGLGYDDGNIRGEWSTRPRLIIPKLGEVALLLGLELDNVDSSEHKDSNNG